MKLIKCVNINKAMGEDNIPPKLIKIADEFFVEPFTETTKSCFNTSIFSDLAKRVSVTPVGKSGTYKRVSTNHRPVAY